MSWPVGADKRVESDYLFKQLRSIEKQRVLVLESQNLEPIVASLTGFVVRETMEASQLKQTAVTAEAAYSMGAQSHYTSHALQD